VTASSALDAGRTVRELASREGDGVHVRLLWDTSNDGLILAIATARTGVVVAVPVRRDRGLDAFYHPSVYAGAAVESGRPARGGGEAVTHRTSS
jgi:hypothetical protein